MNFNSTQLQLFSIYKQTLATVIDQLNNLREKNRIASVKTVMLYCHYRITGRTNVGSRGINQSVTNPIAKYCFTLFNTKNQTNTAILYKLHAYSQWA